jgi:hypothetical protein
MRSTTSIGLVCVASIACTGREETIEQQAALKEPIPLKEAKLIIRHNATDHDTGFQGAIDSEGWRRLDVRGRRLRPHAGARGTLRGPRRHRAVLREPSEPANDGRADRGDARPYWPGGESTIEGPAIETA